MLQLSQVSPLELELLLEQGWISRISYIKAMREKGYTSPMVFDLANLLFDPKQKRKSLANEISAFKESSEAQQGPFWDVYAKLEKGVVTRRQFIVEASSLGVPLPISLFVLNSFSISQQGEVENEQAEVTEGELNASESI